MSFSEWSNQRRQNNVGSEQTGARETASPTVQEGRPTFGEWSRQVRGTLPVERFTPSPAIQSAGSTHDSGSGSGNVDALSVTSSAARKGQTSRMAGKLSGTGEAQASTRKAATSVGAGTTVHNAYVTKRQEIQLAELREEKKHQEAGLDLTGAADTGDKIMELERSMGRTLPQRIWNIFSGAAKQTASSYSSAASGLYEIGQEARDQQNQGFAREWQDRYDTAQRDYQMMLEDNMLNPGTWSQSELNSQLNIMSDAQLRMGAFQTSDEAQRGATQAAHEMEDAITASGAQDLEKAKAGLGIIGQMAVDAGASTLQSMGDQLIAAPLGVGGLTAMAVRSFGGGMQAARQDGADTGRGALYGAATAAKEVFTEKLFGVAMPFAQIYGGGSLDNAVEQIIQKAVDKLATSEVGERVLETVLGIGAGAVTEGLEEFIGDWIEWQLPRLYGGDVDTAAETLSQSLYDFATGAMSGGFGDIGGRTVAGGVNALLNRAVKQVANDGKVSNSTAEAILGDQQAVNALAQEAGLELSEDMTQSKRRAAVKDAVESLVSRPDGSETQMGPSTTQAQTNRQAAPSVQARATQTTAEQAYNLQRVQEAAQTLGKQGARVAIGFYDGTTDAAEYFGGMAVYYQAGVNGKAMNEVRSEYTQSLNDAQRQAAWEAGRNDAAESLAQERRAAQFARVAGEDSGLVYDDYVRDKLDVETADRVNAVAKALGLRAQFVDVVEEAVKANANITGSTVRIEKFNSNPVQKLLGHEITHRVQDLAPDQYRALRNFVADNLSYEVQAVQELYADNDITLTYEQALDEAVADYAGSLMQDGRVMDDFVERNRDNRTLLEKVRDAIRELVRKLTGVDRRQAETAEGKLNAALDAAAQQAQALEQQKNAAPQTESGEARYSINPGFTTELDKWDGKTDKTFDVGTTGAALQSVGVADRGIIWHSRKIAEILRKHSGMTRDIVKQVPEILENPIAVLTSKQSDSRIVIFGELADTNGAPVTAILELQPTTKGGELLDMNVIASAYGKDSNPAAFVESSDILYLDQDKNRTEKWMQGLGLQLPSDATALGSVGTISYQDGKVKIEGVPYQQYMQDGTEIQEKNTKSGAAIAENPSPGTDRSTASGFNDSIPQTDGEVNTKYSLKAGDDARELAAVRRENDRLKAQLEQQKAQMKVTTRENVTLRQGDVDKLARSIVQNYDSKLKAADISADLKSLGELILRGGDGTNDLTWSEVHDRAVDIGRRLVASAVTVDDTRYQQYSSLRDRLRNTKINVPRALWADLGDYNDFRKQNMGRLNLSSADGVGIDQVYKELAVDYPEFFDEEIYSNPADQLTQIADVLDGLQPIYENPFGADLDMAAEWAAGDILERLMSEDVRQSPATFADRQARKQDEIRAKGQQAIERVRAQRDAKVEKLKNHYAEMRKQQSARRADSQARTRLLNIAKRLQNKNLPAVNRALLDQYIGDLDTVSKSMTGKTLERLTELQGWYTDRRLNDPDFIADPAIERSLARLSKRHISDLTVQEVADLTEVLLNIENELRTERKLIDQQDRRDIYHMGEETIRNIYASSGSRGGAVDKYIVTQTLSPTRQMRRLTGYVDSDPLYRQTQALADGQRKMLEYQMKSERPFQSFAQDKSFNRTFSGPNAQSIEIVGQTKDGPTAVTITPAMRAALYLHSLNDQNLRHIRDGGITVPNEKLYRQGKLSEAYARGVTIKLTPSQVRSITANMTAQERAFAQATSRYFNQISREAINEVSEKLKGYSLAQVENYFPINTDTSFTKSDFESIKFDGTIEGMGFLKERQNAATPIMLRDVNAVLEQSIQQHSKYVGLAIPVRNFNKVWGVTTASYEKNTDGYLKTDEQGRYVRNSFESSVQQAVKQKWGESGYDYVEKMMKDLQGGAEKKNDWTKVANKIRSNYAGAVLTLNLSVAMKQAASYPTAAAVLGWGPLTRAMADTGPVNLELIERYTPLQWYRSKGFSTRELGDLKSANKQLPTVLNWVQGVDVLTTRKLWKASEYYVRQNNKALNPGTDAYYRAVADIYNRVIEETQPNYTTMQRPQMLRSDDSLLGNLAMFKTQPFQNFNILYDAAGNLIAKTKQAKNGGDINALKEARRDFGNAVTSQAAQLAVFAGMTMTWAMLRGKKDKYEDEDGDMTLPSVLSALGKDMAGGLFSIVPFGSDAWEAVSSKLFGDTYYGMETATVSVIDDTWDSMSGLYDMLWDIAKASASGEEVKWSDYRLELTKHIKNISKIAGFPAENILNIVKAVYQKIAVKTMGEYEGEYSYLKLTTDPAKHSKDYYNVLYSAYLNDRAAYESIYADMMASGFDADKVRSAMEDRMKDAQGVEKVSELEQRYMTPAQEAAYSGYLDSVSRSSLWGRASSEQRASLEDDLYNLVTGNSAGAKLQEKIDCGSTYGIDETDYLLYQLALDIVDKPTESGKMGSYTNDEVEEAIRMLAGLSDRARSYLWTAQGKNEKSNPWG